MPVWRLILEYEGTRYKGWQEQKNARTVAGMLRQAAEDFFGARVGLSGAGRTDAGVHALAQVARLEAARASRPDELRRALNDRLPADINVLKVEQSRPHFDPRRDAVLRYYVFQISTRRTAFAKPFAWWVKDPLDFERMRRASDLLVGRHDFAVFCQRRQDEHSTIVIVEEVELGTEGDLILFRIGASHFLWKMVRRIVGTLVEVGRGTISVEEFKNLLEMNQALMNFNVAARTAPPSGLFLERVVYDKAARPKPLAAPFPVPSLSS